MGEECLDAGKKAVGWLQTGCEAGPSPFTLGVTQVLWWWRCDIRTRTGQKIVRLCEGTGEWYPQTHANHSPAKKISKMEIIDKHIER